MTQTQEFTTSPCRGLRLVATCADGAQGDCELGHAVSILGSGDWCDVILESPEVAPAHAAIVKYGGSGYLCDLGAKGGSMLNDRLVRWARLTPGDRIGIGPFEFVVQIDHEESSATLTQPIFGLLGDEELGFVTSIDPVLLIGAHEGCDIVLNESGVKPQHALIVWTDRGPIARDLTGDRMTFIDGQPVSAALLKDGMTVGVGSHEFVFEIENEPTFEQTVGGRFSSSENAGNPDDAGADEQLVAGRFGERLAEIESSREPKQPREVDPGSAVVQNNKLNYFSNIVQNAGTDLSQLAEMERLAALEPPAPRNDDSESDEAVLQEPISTKGMSPEAILRKAEQLQSKTAEMRRRVAEAQSALDSRAQKHREEILRERKRLREKRAMLQLQAKALLEAAKTGKPSPDRDSATSVAMRSPSPAGSVIEINDDPAQNAFVEYVASEGHLSKLLSGGLDLQEQSDFNAKETDRILNDPRSYAEEESLKTLDDRVAELIRVAQAERKEIERGEALVETLRFETERQRRALARRQEKLQSRERSLEDRFRSLTKARDAIRKERAPLLARLKTLDGDESVIRERLSESERLHQDLVRESESIDEVQEGLETRERALLHKLELERQRLLARQAQLKRKAAQLAKAAREKRMSIEKDMLRQQAELEAREAELRAKRMEIEETARGELEKTAGGLEQVLSVRLSEIEAELESRRIDLDTKVQELAGLNHAHLRAAREASDPIDAPLRRIASEFTGYNRIDDEEDEADHRTGTLDNLAAEIDAFSRRTGAASDEDAAPQPVSGAPELHLVTDCDDKLDSIPLEPSESDEQPATTDSDLKESGHESSSKRSQ